MDKPRHEELPAELAEMASRLQDERPALTGLELDQIKLHAKRRAARHGNNTFLSRQRRAFMKSRMAITSLLVLGVLVSGTGTGLAISGVSDSGSAGVAQYPTTPTVPQGGTEGQGVGQGGEEEDGPEVLGEEEAGGGGGGQSGVVAGAQQGGTTVVHTTRQVSVQGGGSLPFTGLAAIPVILVGLALLVGGAMMRRRLPEGV